MSTEPAWRSRGATLIEMIITIVVIGVGIAGMMLAFNRTVSKSADPMINEQANAIAHAYLEEILLHPFCDPSSTCTTGNAPGTPNCDVCPSPEASRDLYDNVCDYNGLSDSGARDQNNNTISGLGSYNIAVSVSTSATLNGVLGSQCQLLRVQVNISHSSAEFANVVLYGHRTNY